MGVQQQVLPHGRDALGGADRELRGPRRPHRAVRRAARRLPADWETSCRAQPSFGYVLLQPVGFLLFLIASNAEINRGPFDLPESDSELVSGFVTEYSAMRFAFFFLAEYTNLFLAGAFAATLFLGGWRGPLLPPVVWFLLKSYFVVFVLIWIRWTFPRLRVDHLMAFSWKVLLPLALANLLVTAVLVKVL